MTDISDQSEQASRSEGTTAGSLLSEIIWLQAQSPRHRYSLLIGDLEWAVFPAVMNGQAQVFRVDARPFAAALWAFVSDHVDQRLAAGAGRLKPEEWRSGAHVWLVDLVAPWGHAERVLEELRNGVLADHMFKCQHVSREGVREVRTVHGCNMGQASDGRD